MRWKRITRVLLFITGILMPGSASLLAQWQSVEFGKADRFVQGICLGPGITDSRRTLYAASGWGGNGKGYEWTYSDGIWKEREVYSGLGVCYSPVVAAIRGSPQRRLYMGSYTRREIVEVVYEAGVFLQAAIEASRIDRIVCLRAAAARNDNILRLYMSNGEAGDQGGLYEFSWNPIIETWDRLKIYERDVGEFAVADGRNDGLLRIYAGAREGGDGGVVEFTWNGSEYLRSILRFDGILAERIQTTYVGDGRGDGKNRLYANEWGGRLFELSYGSDSWSLVRVAGNARRFYLYSGRLHPDQQSRLYASLVGQGIYEYTWNGTAYESSVDAITAATGRILIGDGRGDGKNRLYAGGGDRSRFPASVVEISHSQPPDANPLGGFRRGDVNGDGLQDISDAIRILFHLFASIELSCEDAADTNDDSTLDLSDSVRMLGLLFLGGEILPPPFSLCGEDSTGDDLTCETHIPCGK